MLKILQFLHTKPIYVIIFYVFWKTYLKVNFSYNAFNDYLL